MSVSPGLPWTRRTNLKNLEVHEIFEFEAFSAIRAYNKKRKKWTPYILSCTFLNTHGEVGVLGLVGLMCQSYSRVHESETTSQHTTWQPNRPKFGKNGHFPLKQAHYKTKSDISGHFLHFKNYFWFNISTSSFVI